MADIYTEEQLLAQYRLLSDENKRRITKIIANLNPAVMAEDKADFEADKHCRELQLDSSLSAPRTGLRCGFCGKTNKEVFRLVVGNGTYICDECVRKAYAALDSERRKHGEPKNH